MKFNRFLLIAVALILAIQPSLPVQAAEGTGAYPYPLNGGWRTITNGNYFVDLAASGNYLWAASHNGGLFRWDTRDGSYIQYTVTDGLPSSVLYSVALDKSGNVWVGSNGFGVGRFDGANWKIYTVADGLADNTVGDIAVDANGNIWFATHSGVSKYDGTAWTNYTSANGYPSASAYGIAIDPAGNLWFGSGDGVIKFDGVNWTTYTTADGLVNDTILAITFDLSGNLWVGTFVGVSKFDGKNWTTYTTEDGLIDNIIHDITVDKHGNIWIAAGIAWSLGEEYKAEVSKFDGQTWTNYTTDDGLLAGIVYSIAFDTAGNAWFGSLYGISRFDGTTWNSYSSFDPFPDADVYQNVLAIAADPRGTVWFGTANGLRHIDSPNRADMQLYSALGRPGPIAVFRLGVDGKGDLWAMADDGLTRYGAQSGTYYGFTTPATNADNPYALTAISGDTHGNAWFANQIGAVKFDGHTWTVYDQSDGLATSHAIDVVGDAAGNVWFATSKGVSKFDGTNWTTYTSADGLVNDSASHITVDHAGPVWALTGRWVNKFDGTTWASYEIKDAGLSGLITSMAVDLQGNLWLGEAAADSTGQPPGGIVRFDGQYWMVYTFSGNLENSINDVAAGPDGSVWFATGWGAREFYPLPQLVINATNGAPGSYFNLTGFGFQPGQIFSLSINNVPLGETTTSLVGTLNLSLDTQNAADGYYILTINDLPGPSASFQLDAAADALPRQGDYELFNLPETPVYTRRGYFPLLRK